MSLIATSVSSVANLSAIRAAMADVVLEHLADGFVVADEGGRILLCNRSVERLFGWTAEALAGRHVSELLPSSKERRRSDPELTGAVEDQTTMATAGVRRNGTRFPMELVITPFDVSGERCAAWILRDVTERTKLEAQLRQSQKMDAMGQLAGGVAHDFNNLLTVITGCCETLHGAVTDDHRPAIEEIRGAAARAASLTTQLLAFSRKSDVTPRVVDLNEAIGDVAKMLVRVIGEDVSLEISTDPRPQHVRIDTGQLAQVLVNLAVNARDAMPNGGRLSIRTSSSPVDRVEARPFGVDPGAYVCLTVSDTGHGMTAEVAARVFEPFFSTKGERGTGLGLATVYGIVRQAGGTIFVRSRPGQGAVFTILLPSAPAEAKVAAESRPVGDERGTELLLVVEDEPQVCAIAVSMLRARGYRVLVASTPSEALEVATAHPALDLVVSDVVMPGRSGPELVAALRTRQPGLPALYVSGYAADAVAESGGDREAFLQKPYSGRQLSSSVRRLLDACAQRDSGPRERRGALP